MLTGGREKLGGKNTKKTKCQNKIKNPASKSKSKSNKHKKIRKKQNNK